MTTSRILAALVFVAHTATAQGPERPFGTLRDQAEQQQQWLEQRMTTVLPALMQDEDEEVDPSTLGRPEPEDEV